MKKTVSKQHDNCSLKKGINNSQNGIVDCDKQNDMGL